MPASEILYDNLPIYAGKAEATGAVLRKQGADFRSCGVLPGVVCYNVTAGTHGLITAVDENSVTATGVTWTAGDTFSIYATAAKDAVLGQIYTDLRFGRKAEKKVDLTETGYFPEDVDLDETERDVFGPGQPEGR
jgi:hypothetical protein